MCIYTVYYRSRSTNIALTWPAPSLVVSAIFVFDVEGFGSYLVMDLVAAVHFNMRVYDGHHLPRTGFQWIKILHISKTLQFTFLKTLSLRIRFNFHSQSDEHIYARVYSDATSISPGRFITS